MLCIAEQAICNEYVICTLCVLHYKLCVLLNSNVLHLSCAVQHNQYIREMLGIMPSCTFQYVQYFPGYNYQFMLSGRKTSWGSAGPSSVQNWLARQANVICFLGLTSIKILFHRGVLPLKSSSLEAVFH